MGATAGKLAKILDERRAATNMSVQQRLAPAVKRTREAAVVDDIPYIDLVGRDVRSTSREPFTVRTVHHNMPRIPVDGVVEAVCWFKLGVQVVIVVRGYWIFGEVELAKDAI